MEKLEPKHQAEFVPSGYPALTWDMLTPDLLFSFGSSSIEGLHSSIQLETVTVGKGQAAWKEDIGNDMVEIIRWTPESVRLELTSGNHLVQPPFLKQDHQKQVA